MKRIYLDNAATTKVDEWVLKAMQPFFSEKFGNASSQHFMGQEVAMALEESRDVIARSIRAKSDEIFFTSGGTESNNWVIKGMGFENLASGKNHIITTKIEHDCILNSCRWMEKQGFKVTYLDVDEEGFVNPEDVLGAITGKTILVSIIHGNNEIGTIQDIEAIGKICRECGVYFHIDACQSYTKVPIDVRKQNLDFVTLNAHKIYGPKGVGVLYIREGVKITPLIHGGNQEDRMRSGTENIPGIVGFAKAVKISNSRDVKKMTRLRDKLINELSKIPHSRLNGPRGDKRLCNNINFSFEAIEGEAIGAYLDVNKICSSTGSACSSRSLEPSHVIRAIGVSPSSLNSSIRLSLNKNNTEEEIDYVIKVLGKIIFKLRRISPFKLK
ncbi:MAG: aminotransferase class V-fold PLP-dependent enzyme [Nanoarchaeota archaeon]|nr:aminotransferase class V-fold PLP-dependent enzyme [Nanoarchaeota archaeon]